MSFVEEFRKNIPYIADGMGEWIIDALQNVQVPIIHKNADQLYETMKLINRVIEKTVHEALTDWLNEYQTEEAKRRKEEDQDDGYSDHTAYL